MERREILGILSGSAAGILAVGAQTSLGQEAVQKKGRPGGRIATEGHAPEHHDHSGHSVVDECARICNETAAHCLKQVQEPSANQAGSERKAARSEGGQGNAQQVPLLAHAATMDCQAFCQLTSALSARQSALASHAHEACANACRDCAEVCEQGQDEVMKRCAEICRQCEQHCRQQMSQAGKTDTATSRPRQN